MNWRQILGIAASDSDVGFTVQSFKEALDPHPVPGTQALISFSSPEPGCTVRPDMLRSSAQSRMEKEVKYTLQGGPRGRLSLSVPGILRKWRFTLRHWLSISLNSRTIFGKTLPGCRIYKNRSLGAALGQLGYRCSEVPLWKFSQIFNIRTFLLSSFLPCTNPDKG